VTDPIPTKLHENDAAWLDLICSRTGMKRAEVIRRAIRVLAQEVQQRPKWNWVQETAKEMPPLDSQQKLELGNEPPANFDEANARAKAKAAEDRQRHPRRSRS
jgi:hypothetical protein